MLDHPSYHHPNTQYIEQRSIVGKHVLTLKTPTVTLHRVVRVTFPVWLLERIVHSSILLPLPTFFLVLLARAHMCRGGNGCCSVLTGTTISNGATDTMVLFYTRGPWREKKKKKKNQSFCSSSLVFRAAAPPTPPPPDQKLQTHSVCAFLCLRISLSVAKGKSKHADSPRTTVYFPNRSRCVLYN